MPEYPTSGRLFRGFQIVNYTASRIGHFRLHEEFLQKYVLMSDLLKQVYYQVYSQTNFLLVRTLSWNLCNEAQFREKVQLEIGLLMPDAQKAWKLVLNERKLRECFSWPIKSSPVQLFAFPFTCLTTCPFIFYSSFKLTLFLYLDRGRSENVKSFSCLPINSKPIFVSRTLCFPHSKIFPWNLWHQCIQMFETQYESSCTPRVFSMAMDKTPIS